MHLLNRQRTSVFSARPCSSSESLRSPMSPRSCSNDDNQSSLLPSAWRFDIKFNDINMSGTSQSPENLNYSVSAKWWHVSQSLAWQNVSAPFLRWNFRNIKQRGTIVTTLHPLLPYDPVISVHHNTIWKKDNAAQASGTFGGTGGCCATLLTCHSTCKEIKGVLQRWFTNAGGWNGLKESEDLCNVQVWIKIFFEDH
jgi:hypothetical protein